MSKLTKLQLRKVLRQRRRSLSVEQQTSAMQAVSAQASSLVRWAGAKRIALYHPADGEIDTRGIVSLCRAQNKEVYLPVIHSDMSMDFAQWIHGEELTANKIGIFEPPSSAIRCPPTKLDILFLPLVGWDKLGGRLGMGAGYYDRVLAKVCGPLLAGLAHDIQEVKKIPQDSWDIPLHAIITGTATYHCEQ